jgi:predicted short-subunit dehydrogenase-like oxidoreductase (DUF2520 family)
MFARKRGLPKAFKLVRKMSVETVTLLDEMRELRHFHSAEGSKFFCSVLYCWSEFDNETYYKNMMLYVQY